MAIALIVFLAVSAASAAPPLNDGAYRDWQKELFERMELNKLQELYPTKRSNYGYASPCAAASSAPMSYAPTMTGGASGYASAAGMSYSPSHAVYQTSPAYHQQAYSHYAHPYYRTVEDENEQEILGFSDMDSLTSEHMPMARYSYGAPSMTPVAGGSAGAGQAAASGPVVGVFSNTNVGGCSVPLLVSCSPSIAHGRIVKTHPYYDNSAAPAQQANMYRVVEEHSQHEEATGHHENSALISEHSLHNSKPIGDKHQ